MQLSLSVRIAEAASKDRMTIEFGEFAQLARDTGYQAVCIRASAGGVQTSPEKLRAMRGVLDDCGLPVSMVTTDFQVPLNNDQGPENLRDFGPHLDVAEIFSAPLIRVCMKTDDDIPVATRASDMAAERGIRVAHQCHTDTLFETIDQCLDVVRRVARPNFGLIYEPGNLLLCGEPYGAEAIRSLAPHLMNVYLQNHRLDPAGPECLPVRARGQVRYHNIPLWDSSGLDFEEIFAALAAVGYAGTVTVHQEFARLMGPDEAACKSHAFLTSLADF